MPWQNAEWALLLSSLCHVVAHTGYIWLVGKAGAVFTSQMAYLVTVSAVLFSALMLSEIYSGWVWSALVLMSAGLALVQPHGARQPIQEISGKTIRGRYDGKARSLPKPLPRWRLRP